MRCDVAMQAAKLDERTALVVRSGPISTGVLSEVVLTVGAAPDGGTDMIVNHWLQ